MIPTTVPFWYLIVGVLGTVACAWLVFWSKLRLERRARRACETRLVPATYAAGRARVRGDLVASVVGAVAAVADAHRMLRQIDDPTPSVSSPPTGGENADRRGREDRPGTSGHRYPWAHLEPGYTAPSPQATHRTAVKIRRIPVSKQSPWVGAMEAIQPMSVRRREVAAARALSRQARGLSWAPETIARMRTEVVSATRELLPNVGRRPNMPTPVDTDGDRAC